MVGQFADGGRFSTYLKYGQKADFLSGLCVFTLCALL